MKAFFKDVLRKTATNFVSFLIVFSLGLILSWLILLSLGGDKEIEEKDAFLAIDLSINLTDRPEEITPSDLLSQIAGGSLASRHHLFEVLKAVRRAAEDNRIRGIFLHGSLQPSGYGSGYAALAELNEELARFKQTGKPVVAFADHPTIRDYYVLSLADELLLHPYGEIMLEGFAAESAFFGNAFEKYGVNVQLVRTGKFKGAAESLISDRFSDENREQIQSFLDQRWQDVLASMAHHRDIQPERLRSLLEERFHFSPEEAAVHGLVDRIAYADEAIDRLAEIGSRDEETGHFVQIELGEYINEAMRTKDKDEDGGVAIVYVEGAINDQRVNLDDAGAEEIAAELFDIRWQKTAEAVVLRVNSPGGGVTASETIQREVAMVRQAGIPVVVSMGSVAASGGYWISAECDRIFARPETLTGSIGVFGLFADVKELAESFGVNWDVVKTSPHADVMSFARPKTEKEISMVQEVVDDYYDRFVEKVATGRDLSKEEVQRIAQGHVWSGRDARENGLVDQFGGLWAAIDHAAKLADLSAGYAIAEYPRKRNSMEAISEILDLSVAVEAKNRLPAAAILEKLEHDLGIWSRLSDPRGTYALLPWRLRFP